MKTSRASSESESDVTQESSLEYFSSSDEMGETSSTFEVQAQIDKIPKLSYPQSSTSKSSIEPKPSTSKSMYDPKPSTSKFSNEPIASTSKYVDEPIQAPVDMGIPIYSKRRGIYLYPANMEQCDLIAPFPENMEQIDQTSSFLRTPPTPTPPLEITSRNTTPVPELPPAALLPILSYISENCSFLLSILPKITALSWDELIETSEESSDCEILKFGPEVLKETANKIIGIVKEVNETISFLSEEEFRSVKDTIILSAKEIVTTCAAMKNKVNSCKNHITTVPTPRRKNTKLKYHLEYLHTSIESIMDDMTSYIKTLGNTEESSERSRRPNIVTERKPESKAVGISGLFARFGHAFIIFVATCVVCAVVYALW